MATRVLITGTTSGVGRALLRHYAQRGSFVIAVNRRQVDTEDLSLTHVRFETVDVRDADAVGALLLRLASDGQLPDVFFLNAGINEVDNDDSFDVETYKAVLQTNLYGVLHFIAPLTRMPASGSCRHIVAIGSMASRVGNPYGLGYSTSKRALSTCFDVWSQMYAGTDLAFQYVHLGPVPTQIQTMERHFPRWVVKTRDLFSGNVGECVVQIARFAESNDRRLVLPRRAIPLYWAMRMGTFLLPGWLRGRRTLSGAVRRRPASDDEIPC